MKKKTGKAESNKIWSCNHNESLNFTMNRHMIYLEEFDIYKKKSSFKNRAQDKKKKQ